MVAESNAILAELRIGKRGILTPISKCGLLWAIAPNPPNRRINPAAARFSKTLMYPSGESIGAM